MKCRAFALCAGILLLGLMPASTLALPIPNNLDQSNAMVPGYSLGFTAGYTRDFAQSFTAGKSGRLSAVDLWLGGSGTIPVSIKATASGLPTGADLATASGTASNPAGWVHFSFPAPPMVTSGTQYAIVFNTGDAAVAYGSPNNYAGGQALMYDSGWVPITTPDRPDWAFQTYVDTVTTVAQWDKASITAGATTPLTLTVTMTFHNGVEAKTYGVMIWGFPSWYTPQSTTCSSLHGADPAPVCTLQDLQINGFYVNASATGDTLTVIVTGTAAPALYDAGYPGVASPHAWIHYTPDSVFIEAVGDATVQVVAPAATAAPTTAAPTTAAPTTAAPTTAAPTTAAPTTAATPPPTSTGVGPASDDPSGTLFILLVALVAFSGSLLALVTRQRRRIS